MTHGTSLLQLSKRVLLRVMQPDVIPPGTGHEHAAQALFIAGLKVLAERWHQIRPVLTDAQLNVACTKMHENLNKLILETATEIGLPVSLVDINTGETKKRRSAAKPPSEPATVFKQVDHPYVSLKMLEDFCAVLRKEHDVKDDDQVVFGEMCVDNTFLPRGPVLALGQAQGKLLIVVKDADVPVLP